MLQCPCEKNRTVTHTLVRVEELEDRGMAPGAMGMCVLGGGGLPRMAPWLLCPLLCPLKPYWFTLKAVMQDCFLFSFCFRGHCPEQGKRLFALRASPAALGTALRQSPQACSIPSSPAHAHSSVSKEPQPGYPWCPCREISAPEINQGGGAQGCCYRSEFLRSRLGVSSLRLSGARPPSGSRGVCPAASFLQHLCSRPAIGSGALTPPPCPVRRPVGSHIPLC